MQRSLEAYQRSGNLVRQADALSSLGAVCHWAGRWDEALSYYERGRDEAMKIGDTVGAALARINVAEILIDRGEWTEAEALLLETLPLWKASQYRYYLGGCLLFLGRVSLRLGRFDEALSRLEEAKTNFQQVGAEEQVPPDRRPDRGVPRRDGERRRRARTGARHARPRQRIERRGPSGVVAGTRAGACAAEAGRPVGRAGRAGSKPCRGTRAARTCSRRP